MRKELINQLSTVNYATSAGNSLLIVLERKMQEPQKYHFFIKILSVTASGNKLVRGVNSVRLLDMFTLTGQDQHGVKINKTSIRRLTPVECMRLQGFPDDWNEFGVFDGKKVAMSDTQRYKQAGNAVTVNVVQAVAEKIWPLKC